MNTPMDILRYADATGLQLFPVQKFVLKLAYGIPLSPDARIQFEEPLSGVTRSFTEPEYLRFLHAEGRSNIVHQEAEPFGVYMATGRRGGKNTLLGLGCAHAVDRLLRMPDPHRRYGLCGTIGVTFLGVNKEESKLAMSEFTRHSDQRGRLRALCEETLLTRVRFRTKADLRRRGLHPDPSKGQRSLYVSFQAREATSQRSLKGHSHFFVAMSEMAFWSADSMYDAVVPSLCQYRPAKTSSASLESKLLCFSTPLRQEGRFYRAWSAPREPGVLTLRIPTWEMNPTLPRSYYLNQAQASAQFRSEYGAEFGEALRIAS